MFIVEHFEMLTNEMGQYQTKIHMPYMGRGEFSYLKLLFHIFFHILLMLLFVSIVLMQFPHYVPMFMPQIFEKKHTHKIK